MKINNELKQHLTFGFEQTFTIPNWWTDEGFTATSDTPLKRQKMLELAEALAQVMKGSYKESLDIWDHMQYETFDAQGKQSFYVTMDPGSIEVKTPPVLGQDVEKMSEPLFQAAALCDLVPYRNWWYGVKGGTEGGCHVNLGGFGPETNPLKKYPDLVVKYSAYIHNRPWLHYPFMGLDVGRDGNCQRMDEKDGYDDVKKAFEDIDLKSLKPNEVYPYFENTNLINDKCSFPSLKKFKEPDYFLEDRAQEALRSPEDFRLVTDLRLCIFSELMESELEELQSFDNLHERMLTSYFLWEKFQEWANKRDINPVNYQRFFDRQFPRILNGNPPKHFGLKEGRRPRKVLDVKMNNGVAVSKTIDTSYKRIELFAYNENENIEFEVEVDGLEKTSEVFKHQGFLSFYDTKPVQYLFIDLKVNKDIPEMKIDFKVDGKVMESKKFHLNDMRWI